MAVQGQDIRQLMLQVDASVAVAQRNLGSLRETVAREVRAMETDLARPEQALAGVERAFSNIARRGSTSLAQYRAGAQQLGFQIGDVSSQLASGARPLTIFAQQSGQVIQAITMMQGEGNKFLQFLGGPWGAVITGGGIILASLIGKLLETGSALDQEVRSLQDNAEKTERTRRAQEVYANTLTAVTEALRANREAMEEMDDAHKSAARRALESAITSQLRLRGIRNETAATIAQTEAEIALAEARMPMDESATAYVRGLEVRRASLDRLRENLTQTDRDITEAARQIDDATSRLFVEIASRDPVERIHNRYSRLIDAARQRARAEGTVSTELIRQVQHLRAAEAAEVEAEQRRNRRQSPSSAGAQADSAAAADTLASARRFLGLDENVRGERVQLMELFRQANINVDPAMIAWCAAFVNAVLATQGVSGTGQLGARSFLNWGQATDRPSPGDVVVLRRGNDASQGHVGFYMGSAGNGRIRVLGGNQGQPGGVTESTFSSRDVLGYRRFDAAAEQRRRENLRPDLDGLPRGLTIAGPTIGEMQDAIRESAEIAHRSMIEIASIELPNIMEIMPIEDQERLLEFAQDFKQQLAGGLAQAVVYGRDLGDALVSSIQRAAAALLESSLMDLLSGRTPGETMIGQLLGFGGKGRGVFDLAALFGGGGSGSYFSSSAALYAGARAGGGSISAGRAYLVGERGPEMIVPKASGVVIPNHALGAGGAVVRLELSGEIDARIVRVSGPVAVEVVRAHEPRLSAKAASKTIGAIKRSELALA